MVGTHFAHMDSHRVAWAIPVPVGPVGLVRAKVACFQLNIQPQRVFTFLPIDSQFADRKVEVPGIWGLVTAVLGFALMICGLLPQEVRAQNAKMSLVYLYS